MSLVKVFFNRLGRYCYVSDSQYDCSMGNASALYSASKQDFIDVYPTIEKIPTN
jgi:hypothetical protein